MHVTASGTFVSCNSVGHDAATSTFAAPESFHECRNRGIGSQATSGKLSLGQNAFVAAMRAPSTPKTHVIDPLATSTKFWSWGDAARGLIRCAQRTWMFAKCADLDIHIRPQWQGFQNVVKLGRTVDFENADVCPLAGDAP